MNRNLNNTRKEARRLYLTGEASTNAELSAQLGVKPHTVGRWRKEEDWDGLRLKIDRRAAELFTERIASDRVNINLTHYKLWAVSLTRLTESIKNHQDISVKEMSQISGIMERAQRGQRLAKGLALGETEESIKAKSQAEVQGLIDVFIDSVKENVQDEETRDRIRRSLLEALPEEEDDGTGYGSDPGSY